MSKATDRTWRNFAVRVATVLAETGRDARSAATYTAHFESASDADLRAWIEAEVGRRTEAAARDAAALSSIRSTFAALRDLWSTEDGS